MVVDNRDKILAIARMRPILPAQAAKETGTDTILASAMLSELVSKGQLKVSSLKVGSSPLYYVPGQEQQLENFVQNLNEKDRRTVALLSQNKILRDSEQEPLTRVSLRQIKDFAKPLEVLYNDQREIFWKWHALPDSEAENLIKEILIPKVKREETKKTEQVPKEKAKPERKVEQAPKKSLVKKPQTQLTGQAKEEKVQKPTEQKEFTDTTVADPFLDSLRQFFSQNNIRTLEHNIVKKRTEHDFILQIESPLGNLSYYCKAKNKKRIGDSDLSSAFVQGQLKKLPVIFISPGELTKQAKEMLSELRGLTVKKI